MAATTHAYPTRAYRDTEVLTADPHHQVVLLFDTMVRDLHTASAAMAQGDHHAQCSNIVHTQRILAALTAALDEGPAPELAEALYSLYNWLHAKLTEASLADDQPLLTEVTGIITSLRDAWRQAEAHCRGEGSRL